MFDLETTSLIAFILIVIGLAIWDRKNIEFKGGILTRKTKRGKKWFYNVAKKHSKLISKAASVGVVVGMVVSVISLLFLVLFAYNIAVYPEEAIKVGPSAKILLPKAGGVEYPGFVLGIPFWYWLIAIFVVIAVHESAHALVARLKKVTIKSLGVGMFFVIPMAFVEPDERQIKKLDRMSKIKIFAAGSFANLVTALVVFFIFLFLITNMPASYGMKFGSTIPNTPAEQVNLQGVITSINSQRVSSFADFIRIMENVKPNETITIGTTSDEYVLTTIGHPENSSEPFIGIRGIDNKYRFIGIFSGFGEPSDAFLGSYIWSFNLVAWLFIINIGVGAFNLLPIKPLDGGLIYEAIMSKYFKKKTVKKIMIVLGIISIFLLLANLFGAEIIRLLS